MKISPNIDIEIYEDKDRGYFLCVVSYCQDLPECDAEVEK